MNDKLHDTVLSIYDAVANDTLWPDLLQRLAEEVNALGCIVFEWQGSRQDRKLVAPIASAYYDPSALQTYIDRYFRDEARDQDIFEAHSLRRDGIDLIEDDVLSPTVSALKQRPNVQTLQKLGILHRAAGLLNKDNTAVSRFSIQLATDRGQLTNEERAHLNAILPHVAKALDLGRPVSQLAQEHQSMLAAMDRLTIGVCILDPIGRVVVSNEEFKRQQDACRVFFASHTGTLQFTKPEYQRRFESLRGYALNHGRFGARPRKEAIATGVETYLCLELVPLTNSSEIGSKRFGGSILYSTDTSRPVQCNTQPIKAAFALTDAELALVEAISEGLTNAQIAERRGRSVATINSQVKSILSKSSCTTRTQFVRLMMSFGASYLTEPEIPPQF